MTKIDINLTNTKLTYKFSNNFKKDVKLLQSRWYDMTKLKEILLILVNDENLDARYKNHQLKWNLSHLQELHIAPNWLLLYQYIWDNIIRFDATWTHNDLLEK